MNYEKHYKLLIDSRKDRIKIPDILYERHHIQPKCLGGTNESYNLVYLTPREHYMAHWLLWKATHNTKLAYAFGTMMWNKKNRKLTARQYERARNIARPKTEEHKRKISESNKGRKWTPEQRITYIEAFKKRPPQSREVIERQRQSNIGRKHSEETKAKIAYNNSIRGYSEETKEKMSNSAKNLPKIICPHCNKSVNPGNYYRWHGDVCKKIIESQLSSLENN